MEIVASIVLAEQDYGTVTAVEVPASYAATVVAHRRAAGRPDLAMLVASGEDGALLVTAGGLAWRFGGL